MDSQNIKYLLLTIILLILSVFGIFLIFKINSDPLTLFLPSQEVITPTPTPKRIIPTITPVITMTSEATIASKIASPSPTKKPTLIPIITAIPTTKITITPTLTTTSTPTSSATPSSQLSFSSSEDSFSLNYSSSRKLYQDKESTGNRYTFYNISGNLAVHVSPSGIWSWTNSDRNFSSAFMVSGQNTYRYDISTQTIVDLQSSTKNYTLQCVHNGKEDLKIECESFLHSFQLI
jgi:hypothetical protein